MLERTVVRGVRLAGRFDQRGIPKAQSRRRSEKARACVAESVSVTHGANVRVGVYQVGRAQVSFPGRMHAEQRDHGDGLRNIEEHFVPEPNQHRVIRGGLREIGNTVFAYRTDRQKPWLDV